MQTKGEIPSSDQNRKTSCPPPTFFLGIDGGGTKTRFLLADASGAVIDSLTLPGCNPNSVGVDATVAVLRQGICTLCSDIPKTAVFAGIAGCGVGENREALKTFFDQLHFARAGVDNDAANIISAGLQGGDGVIAILGTGSVVFSVKDGVRQRIGGYGYLLGDCFSGCEFGRQCVRAALFQMDGSGQPTVLTQKLKTHLGMAPDAPFAQVWTALGDIYQKGSGYLASFAPLFWQACDEGDLLAQTILQQNAAQLACQLSAALRRFDGAAVPVILAGGLAPFGAQALRSRLDVPVTVLQQEPAVGALWLAGAPRI